jgi:hypothetical protein
MIFGKNQRMLILGIRTGCVVMAAHKNRAWYQGIFRRLRTAQMGKSFRCNLYITSAG